MTAPPTREALYARLREILGEELARMLMNHLPPAEGGELATRDDVAGLGDRLELRVDGLESRMDGLESRMDGLETRMAVVEVGLDGLEARLGDLAHWIRSLDLRLNATNERLDRLHDSLQEQARTYTLAMVGAITTVAALAFGAAALI